MVANRKFTQFASKDHTTEFPLEIKGHDGLYPLLRIPYLYTPHKNPYFEYTMQFAKSRIGGHIRMRNTGYVHKYNIRRRGIVTFYSGYYSVMGVPSSLDYLPSTLGANKKYRMHGDPDIFCLGVVKNCNLPIIDNRASQSAWRNQTVFSMEVNPDNVIILVSKEKMRKAAFSRANYTITARNEILYQLIKLEKEFPEMEIRDVSDEYLDNFYSMPEPIRTNSLVRTMKIEREIKEHVISNFNSLLV